MRDFDWLDNLYCVIKDDGTYAGTPCRTYEEAILLSEQHEGSKIFTLLLNIDPIEWPTLAL